MLSRKIQQFLDLIRAEAASIAVVVDVARRRADQHDAFEELRSLLRGQDADHGADRMSDENPAFDIQHPPNLDNIVGIAVQVAVLGRRECRQI